MSVKNSKYKVEYDQEIIDFFSKEPFEIIKNADGEDCYTSSGKPVFKPIKYPTIEQFAKNIGVCRDTIFEWARVHPTFTEAKNIAMQMAENMVIQNGFVGSYNSTFCMFMLKCNFGYRDGGEIDQAVAKPLEFNFTAVDARKDGS